MPLMVGGSGLLETVIVLSVWILAGLAVGALAWRISGSLMSASIPGALLLATFASQYIGLPILYFGWDAYRAEFVTDRALVAKVWLYTTGSLVMLLLGFSASRHFLSRFPLHKADPVLWIRERIQRFPIMGHHLLFGCFLCVLLLYLSQVGFGNIAILVAITATPSEAALVRSLMGSAFEGPYHWYALFFRELSQVIAFAALARLRMDRSWRTSLWFAVTCAACAFALVMAGEKGPIAYFVFGMICVHAIVWNEGRFQPKILAIGGTYAVAVLAALYIIVMGDRGIGAALWSIVSRGFTGSIQPAYHYLEAFPAAFPFAGGASFPNPGGLLPFEPFLLTQEVYDWVFARNPIIDPVVGTMPTVWWGELYANFGTIGVMIGSVLLGVGLGIVDDVVRQVAVGPIGVALNVWMILYVKDLSVSGASDRVLGVYVIGLGAVVLAVSTLLRMQVQRLSQRSL